MTRKHLPYLSLALLIIFSFSSPVFAQKEQDKEADRKNDPKIEAQIKAVSEDPAFVKSWGGMVKLMEGTMNGLRRMPADKRAEFVKELKAYTSTNKDLNNDASTALQKKLTKMSGISMDEYTAIIKSGNGLTVRHPILNEGSAATAEAAYRKNGMEYNLRDIDPDYVCDEECQCLRNCREEARIAANKAGIDSWIELITGTSIRSVVNWAFLGVKLHQIAEAEVECKKICIDYPPGFDCQTDSDCPDSKYCHKPIGNPVNVCWTKKGLGDSCSRPGKCESGCCKYHFMTNPVHPVCRPSNRCD